MGYQVVKCPKGHVKPTRAKAFRCHGRLFDTSSHILEVTKEPSHAQKKGAYSDKKVPKPRPPIKGPTLKPQPFKVEVSHP